MYATVTWVMVLSLFIASAYVRMHYELTVNPAISSANTTTAIKLTRASVFTSSALTLIGRLALRLRGRIPRGYMYFNGVSHFGCWEDTCEPENNRFEWQLSVQRAVVHSWFFKISFAPKVILASGLMVSSGESKYIARANRARRRVIAGVTRISCRPLLQPSGSKNRIIGRKLPVGRYRLDKIVRSSRYIVHSQLDAIWTAT